MQGTSIPPGNDPRWARWALPLASFLRTPRDEIEISILRHELNLDTVRMLNLLAWLDNEHLAHSVDGRWQLTPFGEQWAPGSPRGPRGAHPLSVQRPVLLVNPRLTGAEFGRWTVIGVVKGEYPTRWWVRCSCPDGIEKAVLASNLKERRSKSCGCLRETATRPRKVSETQIQEAIGRHARGETYAQIAVSLGISDSGLHRLVSRRKRPIAEAAE